jgi:hypothetical protein
MISAQIDEDNNDTEYNVGNEVDEDDDLDEDDKVNKKSGIASEIKGDPSAQYVVFNLKPSENIFSTVNPMYVKGTITTQAAQQNLKSYEYKATTDDVIAFGSSYQNTILKKKLENKVIYISKYNVLAFTNPLSSENEHIVRYENGTIWLSVYGSYEELEVKPGDQVNSGIYLLSDIKPIDKGNGNYSFESATKIMIQTKNIKNFFRSQGTASATAATTSPTAVPTVPTSITIPQQSQNTTQAVSMPATAVSQQSSKPVQQSGWFSKLFKMQGGGSSGNNEESTYVQLGGDNKEVNMRKLLRSI